MSKNIVLVGLSGTGKTTVGKILKIKLQNFSLIDTDAIIVEEENRSINNIFAESGEDFFRNLETKAAQKASQQQNAIVSTGGGIVLREKNIDLLKQNGIIFYLKTSPEILAKRLKYDSSRPLLKTDDIKSKLENMLKVRGSLYEKADVIINTDDLSPEETANEIVRIYNERS
ncbi:MAG: shikimate kinase [Candidatus Gastranaerophilaceae bacterium]